MEAEFWHDKWDNKKIGFHKVEVNPLLVANMAALNLSERSRIFLPLCGKTRDISWLLSNGIKVVGAELSEKAIIELFEDLKQKPQITESNDLKLYQSENIDIFVGDIFKLTRDLLGSVDAVYDRAALVALPAEMRSQYADHLINITENAQQLLISFEYDQNTRAGPPFSVTNSMVNDYYSQHYDLTTLVDDSLDYGMRELVYHLRPLA